MPKKLTIEQFSEDIKNKFGDIYDFSQSKYTGINNKIKVICKKCGYEFYPSPGNLKSGHGCPNCYGNVKKTTEQFIKEAREVHGDKYDYSLVEYKKNHTPVKVICPIHGVWETMPSNHINKKRGCYYCGLEATAKSKKLNTTEFLRRAVLIHKDKYDYSLVEYKGIFSPIKIICPIHGIFEQTPDSHINANCGCPSCNESKGEKKIKKLLNQYNIKYIEQYWFPNCIYKRPLRFDFYLPDYNILVEYQGIQHFVRVKYWDKKQSLEIRQQRDKIKKDFCINERIPLLIINYDEDIERKLRTYLYLPEES